MPDSGVERAEPVAVVALLAAVGVQDIRDLRSRCLWARRSCLSGRFRVRRLPVGRWRQVRAGRC